MTERPILFSGPMVRAILDGTKTETRRVVKWRPVSPADMSATRPPDEVKPYTHIDGAWLGVWRSERGWSHMPTRCPYGAPGDLLWVRETWAMSFVEHLPSDRPFTPGGTWGCPAAPHEHPCVVYRVDGDEVPVAPNGRETADWSPSVHMPRWASRLTLRVEEVRVERLQAITMRGVMREGVDPPGQVEFSRLWDSINAARGYPWVSDPWVWVVRFSRVTP